MRSDDKTKTVLRATGICLICIGVALVAVGFISFFTSFGTGDVPRYFWCCFIGFPALAAGLALTVFGSRSEIVRYFAKEDTPIVADVAGRVARATKDAVDGRISSCGEICARGDRFCSRCGAPLVKICARCKKECDAGAEFCPSCGQRLE